MMRNRKPMARSSIARLNQLARRIEREGAAAADAVIRAADEYGLSEVVVNDRVRLYRTQRNKYVVCWTDYGRVGDGDAGFDDQIELFF